jgi:hypothetical protein
MGDTREQSSGCFMRKLINLDFIIIYLVAFSLAQSGCPGEIKEQSLPDRDAGQASDGAHPWPSAIGQGRGGEAGPVRNEDQRITSPPKDNIINEDWNSDAPTNCYYRLTNLFLDQVLSMAVSLEKDNRVEMKDSSNSSRQKWKLLPQGQNYYRLINKTLGGEFSLAVSENGNNKLQMSRREDVENQLWQVKATTINVNENTIYTGKTGKYQIHNVFLGEGRALDTFADTKAPHMSDTGNFSGQYWKITKILPCP